MSKTEEIRSRFWRMEHLYLIRDKNKRLTKLKFNRGQRRIRDRVVQILEAGKPIKHFDLKFRQGGVTTFWGLFYLDDTIYHRNTVSAIQAQKRESLSHIWDIIRLAHATMPDELRPKLGQDSARMLSFPDILSKIFVALKIQSTGLHNLHVSEYPLCDEKSIALTVGACPPWANITYEGVADGMNHAYTTWQEAKSGSMSYLFHPWVIQEEYRLAVPPNFRRTKDENQFAAMVLKEYGITVDDEQIAYRREAKRNLKELYLQEMAEDDRSCFLASGRPFFDLKKVEVMQRAPKPEPVEQDDDSVTWESPEGGHVYVAAADVAEGLDVGGDPMIGGPDWSVLVILCATCKRVAYRYRARVGVDAFYRKCYEVGMKYNRALLGPELNNHGHAVVMGLREMGYPNLYTEDVQRPLVRKGQSGSKKELRYGWRTTGESKPLMLDQFKACLEGNSEDDEMHFQPAIEVWDELLFAEMFTMRNSGGKISAMAGRHDDVVMAYGIAWQMLRRVASRGAALETKSVFIGGKSESSGLFD